MLSASMNIGDKSAYIAQDYQVAAKRRDYACPNCGSGRLVGHSCRPKTLHTDLDRYLAPILVKRAEFTVDGAPSAYRSLSRFNLFLCPRCYLLIEGPPQLQNGEVQIDRALKGFYLRTESRLPADEGGLTFEDLFWSRLHHNAVGYLGRDWFALAANDGMISDRFCHVFQGRGVTFNSLVDSLLRTKDRAERMLLLSKMNPMIKTGLADLIMREAFRLHPVLFALGEFRAAQYAVMIGRESQKPFRVDRDGDILVTIATWMLDLLIARRPVPHAATGQLMMLAVRMRRFAPNRERLRWLRMVAWLASEHLARKGQLNYNDPSYNPDLPYDNNEAIRYLNLLLRNDLGLEEVTTKNTPAELRSQLTYGLNRTYQYAQGRGTPMQRRACRLGEYVAKLSQRYFPEGTIELINQFAS